MIRLSFFLPTAAGQARTIECRTGQNLMQAAIEAGIDGIEADCGGILDCATCHVYVRAPHVHALNSVSGAEDDMLEFTAGQRKWNSRLSCQIELSENHQAMMVDIPDRQI